MSDGRLFPTEFITAAIFTVLIYSAFFTSYQLDITNFRGYIAPNPASRDD
jgi:hypothetical protein